MKGSDINNDLTGISPLVTIVTVTYNSSAYVRDAIESVLSQSYSNLEYIIGDDCSTDDTWNVIQSYNDIRIRAYRNDFNLREYMNRNKAISMASWKYLLFIDGDDMIYPHGLEFMVKMAEAFPNSAMTIMCSYSPNIFYPVEITPREQYVAEYFNKSLLDVAFTNTLFKTRVLKENGNLPTQYISGDTYIRLKIAQRNSSILINDNLTWWRKTPGQATGKVSSIKGISQNYYYKAALLKDSPLDENERFLALKNIQFKVLRIAIKMILKGKLLKGLELIRETKLLGRVFLFFTYHFVSIDPFGSYSASSPLKLDFTRNPYSKLDL